MYELIPKYNSNAMYSTKELEGQYTGNNVLVLRINLNGKGASFKNQLLNIFKNHHIVSC